MSEVIRWLGDVQNIRPEQLAENRESNYSPVGFLLGSSVGPNAGSIVGTGVGNGKGRCSGAVEGWMIGCVLGFPVVN